MSVATPFSVAPITDCLLMNLDALADAQPDTRRFIDQADPPPSARCLTARDESPTFAWEDEDGRTRWLGRTTMPRIRAEALLDAFLPGLGNVLLYGVGHGLEATELLSRLLPHQAVFVIEPLAWAAKLALRLHDWTQSIKDGRLLLFTGPQALEAVHQFLIERPGYLCPERVLAWPWFDAREAMEISRTLSHLSQAVAAERTAAMNLSCASSESRAICDLAVVSSVASQPVRELSQRIGDAATCDRLICERFALESPRHVEPRHVESCLARLAPRVVLLLDSAPARLSFQLPPAVQVVIPTHGDPLDKGGYGELGETTMLAARSGMQARAAIKAGFDKRRIVPLPDAATTRPHRSQSFVPGQRALVITDIPPCSAEAAGLTLASHQHLWRAVDTLLADRGDAIAESSADRLLDDAARLLKVELKSDAVRAGLIERLVRFLLPARRQERWLAGLARAGIVFSRYDLRGTTSPCDDALTPIVAACPEGISLLIDFTGGSMPPRALLDAAAAGIPVLVRRASWLDEPEDNYRLLESPTHVAAFRDGEELVRQVADFFRESADWRRRAEAARRYVLDHHVWPRRLANLLKAIDETTWP